MKMEYMARTIVIVLICLFSWVSVTIGENFKDLCSPWYQGKKTESFLDTKAKTFDNLMYRTDPNDASGASDVLVSKVGYMGSDNNWNGEIWDMASLERFYDDQGQFTGWDFVGYANNDNLRSNSSPVHRYDGWLNGYMYNNYGVLPVGDRPDDVFLVDDKNGNGVGSVVGATWTLGADDIAYNTSDILFASGPQMNDFRRGDVGSLPAYDRNGLTTAILPNMVVSLRGPGDAIYKNGVRVDREGLLDLAVLSENWMTEGHGAHDYWANGADHNTDGKVDMQDFSILSQNWVNDPEGDYWSEPNFEFRQDNWRGN